MFHSLFGSLGMPIVESTLVPEAREVINRIEWITRKSDGTLIFRHDLRNCGSIYETKTIPRQSIIIPGFGIVMHPEDAAVIKLSSTT